jgi:UDP-N-acetylmuramyl pentapeptide synthase
MHNIAYMCIAITIADVISHRKQYPSLRAFQTLQLPISLQPGRFSLFTSTRGDVIIDSTYNAAPTSMRKVINEGIALQKEFFPQYGIICVLGEMRELGDASQQEHTKLGQWLADKVDMVVGVSGNSVYMTDYLIGLKDPTKHIYRIQTNLEVSDNVRHIMEVSIDKRYIIIFKSSQGEIRLEEAIKSFISQDLW